MDIRGLLGGLLGGNLPASTIPGIAGPTGIPMPGIPGIGDMTGAGAPPAAPTSPVGGIYERIMGGLLGPANNHGGLLDAGAVSGADNDGRMALAASLLQASGPSTQRVGLGQAVGGAIMAGRQAKNESLNAALQANLMKSRIDAQNNRPVSDGVGDYQPGDYTPKSWAEFLRTKDPAVLERYTTPRQEYTPSFRNVTRTLPDGSTELGSFDTRTNQYTWSGMVVPAGTKARVDAEGAATGEAAGAQGAKAPARASFDAALGNLRKSIETTDQGMVAGPMGTLFDYGDKKLFNSRVQQLSTELRTVFRIPGEGTLSDQEQQQYGLQLPSTDNPPEVNAQILNDLEQRVKLRIDTPIDSGSPPAATTPKKKFNPATGKIE